MRAVSRAAMMAEMSRRRGILDACFEKQRGPAVGCIERGERQIAVITSRRAGKTNTVLRTICRDAAENPNCKYAYIGLSRVTAENIVWKELERINDEHNCGLEMQGYRLRAIFPNGSDLTLYGADQPGWLKKFKGAKYRMAIIDEAGEFDIDLHDFVFRVIKPTLSDLRGSVWMIGTPGIIPSGYWWAITRPDEEKRVPGWSVYRWHTFDNPYVAEQFKEDMEQLRSMFGDDLEELPWFRREWLGEWCTDTSNNVYKYDPDRNNVESYEPEFDDTYILCVDPGYKDAAGFVVGAYNKRKNDKLVFVDCFKKVGMSMEDMAGKAMELINQYGIKRVIGDPDSAHFLALMRDVYHIPIGEAKKLHKQENIEYMNNSLLAGKVKFLMPQCSEYAKEITELKKNFLKSDERVDGGITLGEWKENPKQANDLCDCGLYIHRESLHHMYSEPIPKVEHGSADYYTQLEDKLQKQAASRLKGDERWWRQV